MVSSTAARSSMRLCKARSFPSSLQFWCCTSLRKAVPPDLSVLDVLEFPPGLRTFLADNLSWLLGAHHARSEVECKSKSTQTLLSTIAVPPRKVRTLQSWWGGEGEERKEEERVPCNFTSLHGRDDLWVNIEYNAGVCYFSMHKLKLLKTSTSWSTKTCIFVSLVR